MARHSAGDELVAAEIRIALDQLGRVVGTIYADDVLDPPYNFKTRLNSGDGTFGPENAWYVGSCGTYDLNTLDRG